MAFVVPQSGAKIMLQKVSLFMTACTAYLYNNNVTPTNIHVLGDYTAAANMAGKSMTYYTLPDTIAGTATMRASAFTFTQTANGVQTIYGWYLTDGSAVALAERFSSPITLSSNGDQVRLSNHIVRLHS